MGRPARPIVPTADELKQLRKLARDETTPNVLAMRARIMLLSAEGVGPNEIAESLSISVPHVVRTRRRFAAGGLKGLNPQPRPGRPRSLSLDQVMEILRLTIEETPKGATHWSLRLMAKAAGVSQHQVREIWKAAALKPHRIKAFKLSTDPDFAEKVVDIVGLYLNPPENALVLSVDEKTQIQALDRTQPLLPLRPGQLERRTHDYKRHGTLSLYAALNVQTGKVIGRTARRHRAKEFLTFLDQIARETPRRAMVHVILDNSSTHQTKEVEAWLEAHPRFTFHFTPTGASWMNAVETWFSALERRAIRRGIFTSVRDLREAIVQYLRAHNSNYAKPFVWTKSAESILVAVERARRRIHE